MKDIDTMKQGERFDYSSIDIDYLRTLQPLEEWLWKNKKTDFQMRWEPNSVIEHVPPGHPKRFCYAVEYYSGRGEVEGIYVIPDPDNLAWGHVYYQRKNHYKPWYYANGGGGEHTPSPNRYYVVWRHDNKKLWKPLPWDHLRMQVWELDMYWQDHRIYMGHDNKWFSYPYTKWDLRVHEPRIDEHWKDEYKAQVWAQYEIDKTAEIAEKEQYAKQYATIDRNFAIRKLRKYFPDYQPREDLLKDPKSSPLCEYIEPYRWYRLYASLEDQQNDPIFELEHKKR